MKKHSLLDIFLAVILTAAVFLAVLIMLSNGGGPPGTGTAGVDTGGSPRLTGGAAIPGVRHGVRAGIPVLCYHYLRERTGPVRFFKILGALVLNLPLLDDMEIWTENVSTFRHQMEYLEKKGYRVVTLDELVRWKRGTLDLPAKSVAITFDDADRSVYELALPVLREFGYKATVFVVTSRVGMDDWEGVNVMNWDELYALSRSGLFSIESHTNDLHYKVELDGKPVSIFTALSEGKHRAADGKDGREVVFEDLVLSRNLIKDHVGGECRFLAWPYGFGEKSVDSLAAAAGFEGVCTLRAGLNHRRPRSIAAGPGRHGKLEILGADIDPRTIGMGSRPAGEGGSASGARSAGMEIKRYTITARTTLRTFKKMLDGSFAGGFQ
jgi:peptidoglycan/xylan/chitin deacetylase (PgdA/CDA1 family)